MRRRWKWLIGGVAFLVVLAVAAVAVVLGWRAGGGTPDPAALAAAHVGVSRTLSLIHI